MNTVNKVLASFAILGLSAGAAQASLVIDGVHQITNPNSHEPYFIKANSSGNVDIFIHTQTDNQGGGSFMNGLLSVWRLQPGGAWGNWVLIGANDDAAKDLTRPQPGSHNVYGVPVHQFTPGFLTVGITDPGLTLNLTANETYLIIQSQMNNGPKSLSVNGVLADDGSWRVDLPPLDPSAPPQTIPVGSPLENALWNKFDPIGDNQATPLPPGVVNHNYRLFINGDVALTPAVIPVPAAVWLFGSALAAFGVIGRRDRVTLRSVA
jgi:hypothetical protein